jgi:hypothetical protein
LFGRLGQSYFLCDCHPHVANSKNILELKSFADESAEKKKKRKRRKHRQVTRKGITSPTRLPKSMAFIPLFCTFSMKKLLIRQNKGEISEYG